MAFEHVPRPLDLQLEVLNCRLVWLKQLIETCEFGSNPTFVFVLSELEWIFDLKLLVPVVHSLTLNLNFLKTILNPNRCPKSLAAS